MLPSRLKIGDTIGVVAPSNPIVEENIAELEQARKIVEKYGFKVKYSKNLFSNTNGYSSTPEEKAQDINDMFADNEVKMIWCAKGGENSNSTFEYINYKLIKQNPKIFCGYSDITSLTNIIHEKTGLVTYSSTNFKSIATNQTDYSFKQCINTFVNGRQEIGNNDEKNIILNEGIAEGMLIGGNLSLLRGMVLGKYSINFEGKILFLEELGIETGPALVSNYLYYMKQNGVFDKIKGLWIGNYEHESQISFEKIVLDVLDNEYNFPIIKTNNFGHTDKNSVIPIGVKALINTKDNIKIKLIEKSII